MTTQCCAVASLPPKPPIPHRGAGRLMEPGDGELFRFLFEVNESFLKQGNHPITLPQGVRGVLAERFPTLGLLSSCGVTLVCADGEVTVPARLYRALSGPQRTEYWQLRLARRLPVYLSTALKGDPFVVSACLARNVLETAPAVIFRILTCELRWHPETGEWQLFRR